MPRQTGQHGKPRSAVYPPFSTLAVRCTGKAWETPFGDFSPRLEGGAAASTGVAHAVVRMLHACSMTSCLPVCSSQTGPANA